MNQENSCLSHPQPTTQKSILHTASSQPTSALQEVGELHAATPAPHAEADWKPFDLEIPAECVVVAVILTWRGRIGLFRRSQELPHDGGKWHCITGFVDVGVHSSTQALTELSEETGLQPEDIVSLTPGHSLTISDESGNRWLVHTYVAETDVRRLTLNWENDSYRWAPARHWRRFTNRVPWLDLVIDATGAFA